MVSVENMALRFLRRCCHTRFMFFFWLFNEFNLLIMWCYDEIGYGKDLLPPFYRGWEWGIY